MKLSEIHGLLPVSDFVVEYSGHVIMRGTCRSGVITESMIDQMARAQRGLKDSGSEAEKVTAASADMLAAERAILKSSVVTWDYQGEDGEIYPITDEVIKSIPADIRSAITAAVMDTDRPNQTTAEESSSS